MSEGVDERRQVISVFNTVARLDNHATLYLNYLQPLLESKGMLVFPLTRSHSHG